MNFLVFVAAEPSEVPAPASLDSLDSLDAEVIDAFIATEGETQVRFMDYPAIYVSAYKT